MNTVKLLRNLYRHRNLIKHFAWRDFTRRYKGSLLSVSQVSSGNIILIARIFKIRERNSNAYH